ncbi:hypothetical protein ACSFB1_12620, partial [Glaesserella parasuis]|uniref:hypothetical protein n=1 Tax=Glaesserella parasuis TaxID=738 RepID=UPI003F305A1F
FAMILPPNVNGPYSQQPFGFPGQQPPVYGLRPGAPMGPGGFPLAQPFPQAPAFSSPPLAAGGLYQLPHGPVIASNQKIAGNGSFWLSWKGLA